MFFLKLQIKLIIIVFLLCSCTHNKFSGYVYDFDTGKPIQNVVVNINGNSTSTDSIGYFEIEANINSDCVISLKRQGYVIRTMFRKPDFLGKSKNSKIKKSTIYMFKSDSDL
ncbi:hypothetical protein B0A81_16480 [Flavobacterium plurextorum]|uniref:CarboxypepD_reg-like domain-containing protein n=1 Tax=Flavobacterium plurextorum TaxID=1114867 RepID=A0ABX4CRV0_9FLAO|nr:hypothetical protein B0A81_16480 [Flavobacterium plurextorum]